MPDSDPKLKIRNKKVSHTKSEGVKKKENHLFVVKAKRRRSIAGCSMTSVSGEKSEAGIHQVVLRKAAKKSFF